MSIRDAVLVNSTSGAPWLPAGGLAEVYRSPFAPADVSMVRLLIRRDDSAFCVQRDGTGKVDLPALVVASTTVTGEQAALDLAESVFGFAVNVRPLGFVKNTVPLETADYPWPIPAAHFVVFQAEGEPIVDGEWISLTVATSPLRNRHWYPLVHP